MHRLAALTAALLLLTSSPAYASNSHQWRDVASASLVQGWKPGTVYDGGELVDGTTFLFQTPIDDYFWHVTDIEPDGDASGQFTNAGATAGSFLVNTPESPSQVGTYSAVVAFYVAGVRIDREDDASYRFVPGSGMMVNGSMGGVFGLTGYWGTSQAAPRYGLLQPDSFWKWTTCSDTGPHEAPKDSGGNVLEAPSHVIVAYTIRPRVNEDKWDYYWYAYARDGGWFSHESACSTGTGWVSAPRGGMAPLNQIELDGYAAGTLACTDWQPGQDPLTESVPAVNPVTVGRIAMAAHDSQSSSASDRVVYVVNNLSSQSTTQAPPSLPTTVPPSVPDTPQVPTNTPDPGLPTTTTPGGPWYDKITGLVAPLRGLLWPLELFTALASKVATL